MKKTIKPAARPASKRTARRAPEAAAPTTNDRGDDLDAVRAKAYRLLKSDDEVRRKVGRVMLAAWASALGDGKVLGKLDVTATRALTRREARPAEGKRPAVTRNDGIALNDELNKDRYFPTISLDWPTLASVARQLRTLIEGAQKARREHPELSGPITARCALLSDVVVHSHWPWLGDNEAKLKTYFAKSLALGGGAEETTCGALRAIGVPNGQACKAFAADDRQVKRQAERGAREGR